MAEVGAVLVHGLWHGGWAWDGVRARLDAAGVPSAAVELPLTGFEDDVAATLAALDRFGKPAVLVGHSYGGAVVTAAGEHPHVTHLLYLAAFSWPRASRWAARCPISTSRPPASATRCASPPTASR